MERHIRNLAARLTRAMDKKIDEDRRRLATCLGARAFTRPVETICGPRQQALDFLARQLTQGMRGGMERQGGRLAVLAGRLQALSPLATLARGYSICTGASGELVDDEELVQPGDRLDIRLRRGGLSCLVEAKKRG